MRRDAVLDCESYWSENVSIRNMCMRRYMELSETYLWSIVTPGFKFAGSPREFREHPIVCAILSDKDTFPWAVNSNFDWSFFQKDFPDLATGMKGWQCVSDYSVSHQRPRDLASMYKSLTGKTHSKTMRNAMKGVRYDEILSFEQDNVKEMNLGDSEGALDALGELRKLGPMSQTEVSLAAHTRMICRRGMAMDPDYIEKCRQALTWIRHDVAKQLPWMKKGDSAMDVQAFNTYCCSEGVAPPANMRKTDDDFTDWMEANPKLAPVMKARQRYELANRKIQHIEKFLSRCFEGIYYPDLLYCGAPHTRRFSAKGSSDGSQTDDDATHSGFNVQNMDKEPIFGDLLPDFISPLAPHGKDGQPKPGIFVRNFVVPRPGKKFIILDFKAVEPIGLAWLTGQEKFLDLVRGGMSLYEAHARNSGWTWEGEFEKSGLKPAAKSQRIGLGYGCGVKKYPQVAWSLARMRVTPEEAQKQVYDFRRQNPEICGNGWNGGPVGIWARLQNLCQAAGQMHEPLEVALPNGESMFYFNVEQYTQYDETGKGRFCYRADKVLGDPNPKGRRDIYGGKLTENVTQRMCRDLLGEAILRIERAGMPIVFHAHDELIAEVDAADANDAFVEASRIMSEVPPWAEGLPIGISGGVYDRYCKAD